MSPTTVGFQLMLYGLCGVFIALIVFYTIIRLLVKFSTRKTKAG